MSHEHDTPDIEQALQAETQRFRSILEDFPHGTISHQELEEHTKILEAFVKSDHYRTTKGEHA